MPVTFRVPSGTTTRAPTAGAGPSSDTRYVRRSRVGTGTATRRSICDGGKCQVSSVKSQVQSRKSHVLETSNLRLENLAHDFHVFPHLALARGIAEQVRRV